MGKLAEAESVEGRRNVGEEGMSYIYICIPSMAGSSRRQAPG